MAKRLGGIPKLIQAVALTAMLVLLLLGAPKPTVAFWCEDDVIECHPSAGDCVAHVNDPCSSYGQPQCPGVIKCEPGSTWDCEPENEFAEVCKMPDPE